MATKKAGSAAKKTTRSKSQTKKSTVTTVKAVKAEKVQKAPSLAQMVPDLKLDDKKTAAAAAFIGEFVGVFLLTCVFLISRGYELYVTFTLVGLFLMVGTLSGAHLNPLVTVGAWVTRKLSNVRAAAYVVAQLLGAGAAYVVLSTFIDGHVDAGGASVLGQSAPELFKLVALNKDTQWYVFFAELLGATIFAFAFAGAWREKTDRVAKAFTVGFGLLVALIVASYSLKFVSQDFVAVLNPAVALAASAVVDWAKIDWFSVAAYLVAPLIGGVVGFALRDAVEVK
ncbi:aquaporin [Candidatus Saccharibacteria bacterium]|nr:aquaporin [Candidatus Saccharibacteria bacterium]